MIKINTCILGILNNGAVRKTKEGKRVRRGAIPSMVLRKGLNE